MRSRTIRAVAAGMALGLSCLRCEPTEAQLLLPPNYGAGSVAVHINQVADYLDGLGSYLVKESIARRHHAAAAEHEIRNSLLWVATYFERKDLNRAYRLKVNPPFLDKEENRRKQTERRIEKNPDLVLKGDVTDELNWLLRELAGLSMAYQLLPGPESMIGSPVDQALAPGDAHHLRLTDGGLRGGEMLVFRADEADLQAMHWPRALRRAEFDEARGRFEHARDRAVRQIRDEGALGREAEESLMLATDQLCSAFNAAFRPKQQAKSYRGFALYTASKLFLQSLAASVYRLIDTNDARAFDGSYRFQGESTVELLYHLNRYGLQFAPPEPGDEGTYRKLFFSLRAIYNEFTATDDSSGGAK